MAAITDRAIGFTNHNAPSTMKKTSSRRLISGLLALFFLTGSNTAFPCTDFILKARDGSVINARTNEFAIPANSSIVFVPAGKNFSSTAPDGQKGLSWQSRYGFLGLNGMGMNDKFVDGMNEKGLSAGQLLFLESRYESIDASQAGIALSNIDMCAWILGNFSTVDEVKRALPGIRVWMQNIEQLKSPLPLHVAIHDAKGNSMVLEFINGEKRIYDNPAGVMTNMPELPWHLTNLRTYANLNPYNAPQRTIAGTSVKPIGQGSGWLGLPGDWTPTSRFVRITEMVNSTFPPADAREALSNSIHIINNVDIPFGVIREKMADGSTVCELTQWTIFKDLTNKILYFRTYNNSNLRCIDLARLSALHQGGPNLELPVNTGPDVINLTKKMVRQPAQP
jgi:choloylglycine hydrolase